MAAVTWLSVGAVVAAIWRVDHTFTYPLDDPYIHLALARNLLDHGTFGVVPGHYASASSSPLWTLLLAAAMVVVRSHRDLLPLGLNLVLGTVLCWQLAALFAPVERGGWRRWLWVALLLVCAVGVASLVVTGMEHVLQCILVLAAIRIFERVLHDRARRDLLKLGVCLAAATLVRFETVFLGAMMVAVVLWPLPRPGQAVGAKGRRALTAEERATLAGTVVAGVGLAFFTFAFVNRSYGGFALPNSVVEKSLLGPRPIDALRQASTWSGIGHRAASDGTVLAMLAAAVVIATTRQRLSVPRAIAWTVIGVIVLQVVFAADGNLYVTWARYTAYLVLLGAVITVRAVLHLTAAPKPSTRILTATLVVLLVVTAAGRTLVLWRTPAAGHDVYRQQYQMARFLGRYYDGRAVVANDIGEIAFRHRGGLVDLGGLGTTAVLRAQRNGTFDARFVGSLARSAGAPVAVAFAPIFRPVIPASWVPVGEWCVDTSPGTVLGNPCVTWYATSSAEAGPLRARLAAFRGSLPEGVHVQPATATP